MEPADNTLEPKKKEGKRTKRYAGIVESKGLFDFAMYTRLKTLANCEVMAKSYFDALNLINNSFDAIFENCCVEV